MINPVDRYLFRLSARLGVPVGVLANGRPDPVVSVTVPRYTTGAAAAALLFLLALPLPPLGAAVLVALTLTSGGLALARTQITLAGAGTPPLPLWEIFHWMSFDRLDAEQAERAAAARRNR